MQQNWARILLTILIHAAALFALVIAFYFALFLGLQVHPMLGNLGIITVVLLVVLYVYSGWVKPIRRAITASNDENSAAKRLSGIDDRDSELRDKLALRELVENWAIWRDAGLWEKFRTVWHDDGRMLATWTQGSADEFIEMNKQGWDRGVSILHFLGGFSAEVAGTRALTQTKMTISQRGEVHGVLVDVVCTGRFYDFLEKRDGRWGMCLRQPIYEKDRMDPVEPGASVTLDPGILASFPSGYRHLAYLQSQLGYPVKRDMPGLKGAGVEALYATGADWLAGKSITWAGHTWGAV